MSDGMKKREDPEVYRIAKDLPAGQPIEWEKWAEKFGLSDSDDPAEHKSYLLDRNNLKTRANNAAQVRKADWRLITTFGVGITRREGMSMVNEITKEVLTRVGNAVTAAQKEMGRLHLLPDNPTAQNQMIEIVLSTIKTQIDIERNMIDVLPVDEVKQPLKLRFDEPIPKVSKKDQAIA